MVVVAAAAHRTPEVLIPDRAEFIDAIRRLQRGRTLVRSAGDDPQWLIDGHRICTAHEPLLAYGLLEEIPLDDPEAGYRCYRLAPSGRDFAARLVDDWRRRPWLRRLAVRLLG